MCNASELLKEIYGPRFLLLFSIFYLVFGFWYLEGDLRDVFAVICYLFVGIW